MARMVWVAVLLAVTLALGGCAGLPYGALASALGGGYDGSYGGGYGGYGGGYAGGCPQPGPAYGQTVVIPVPMNPGYGGYGAPGMAYAPQVEPYYPPQSADPYGRRHRHYGAMDRPQNGPWDRSGPGHELRSGPGQGPWAQGDVPPSHVPGMSSRSRSHGPSRSRSQTRIWLRGPAAGLPRPPPDLQWWPRVPGRRDAAAGSGDAAW